MFFPSIRLAALLLALQFNHEVHAFINCPPEGYKLCSSTEVAYSMTGMKNLNISDCVYENCPQIIITDSANVSFNNVTFRKGNYSANSYGAGGALLIQGSGSSVKITNSQFDRVAILENGSAIFVNGSSVILVNCTFSGNKATSHGGAILSYNSLAFNCTRCLFYSNDAASGGAVSVSSSFLPYLSPAFFIDCLFDGNHGDINGGSISALYGVNLILLRSEIVNGFAEGGGGIFIYSKSSVALEDCSFSNLTSDAGSFLYSDGRLGYNNLIVKNSIFEGLTSNVGPGALLFKYGGTVQIEGSVFIRCFTAYYGSCIYGHTTDVNIHINVFNCSFYDNHPSLGGTIYGPSLYIDNCRFYNSFTVFVGAAVFVDGDFSISKITNSEFFNCQSVAAGGAIAIDSGDNYIGNCYFTGSNSTYGGAIYAFSNASVTLQKSVFVNNVASANGGDVQLSCISASILDCQFYNSIAKSGGSIFSDSPITITNNTFRNTKAIANGGAISLYESASATLIGCRFFNSTATFGGALLFYPSSNSALQIQNSNFSGCRSKIYGGVLYIDGGSASILNVIVEDCSSCYGGFIYTHNCGQLNIINVQVYSATTSLQGGVIQSAASIIVLDSCQFYDSIAPEGGSIYLSLYSHCSANNIRVIGSQAVFGATFYLDGGSSASCTASTFLSSISNSNGSLIYGIDGSAFSLVDSIYQNDAPETFTGCLFYVQGSHLYIKNFDFEYGISLTGTFLNAIQGSSGTFESVKIQYLTATEKEGSIVIANSVSTLQFTNCTIIHPRAERLFVASDSSQIVFTSTVLEFNTSPYLNLPLWLAQINQVLFQSDSGSSISLLNNSQVKSFIGITVSMVNPLGSFSCDSSEIDGSSLKYAPIYGKTDSSINLSNCQISSNVVLGVIDTCNVLSGTIGLGGAIASSGNVVVTGTSKITSNTASYGGAIYISDPGTLSIGSGAIIWNNTATTYGGAFYIDTGGSCQIEASNLVLTKNSAISYPSSDLALFKNGFLLFTSLDEKTFNYDGGILVLNHTVAETISALNLTIPLEGRAKALTMINYLNGSTIELTMNADIPPIEIGALDGFNRLALVDIANIVVVNTEEVNQGYPLKGETIKTILDPIKRTTTLYFLSIPNRTPGNYSLKFTANHGSLDNSDLTDMPLILNIKYRLCIPGVEISLTTENSCIPIVGISGTVWTVIISICFVLIGGCFLTLYGLYSYKEERLIKANSYVFLSFPVLGCILAFLSPVVYNFSCIFSTALENIGFCLIFTSLLIKLYRIRVLCGDFLLTPNVMKMMKERNLVLALILAVLLFASYEVVWGLFENPKPIPTYIPGLKIVTLDKCNLESFFAYGIAAIKFVISVIVSYLAFVNRKAPSEFNEAKFIGYSCYNWVIFGTFIGLTSQYLITDPDSGYIVKSLSLILSHACTTLCLSTFKVYKCWSRARIIRLRHYTTSNIGSLGTSESALSWQ